tara:strand:- start:126 stop:539 length:414 start_codon:yes stop_codon:yes gene_type:complete
VSPADAVFIPTTLSVGKFAQVTPVPVFLRYCPDTPKEEPAEITPPKVDIPVTFNCSNVGVSDIVMVAIPLGCGSALAKIFTPRKSSVVILPAVPTSLPSSLTIIPFRILLTEKMPGTVAHSHVPSPLALRFDGNYHT